MIKFRDKLCRRKAEYGNLVNTPKGLFQCVRYYFGRFYSYEVFNERHSDGDSFEPKRISPDRNLLRSCPCDLPPFRFFASCVKIRSLLLFLESKRSVPQIYIYWLDYLFLIKIYHAFSIIYVIYLSYDIVTTLLIYHQHYFDKAPRQIRTQVRTLCLRFLPLIRPK